jgi:hypothetical protein
MLDWSLITVLLLLALALVRPEQLQVVLYKSGLVTLGAVLGYWIDKALFPEGRPAEQNSLILVGAAYLRRSLIVLACVLGLTLGL